MSKLAGTKTAQNLKDAFAGESQANRRYLYFAQKADIEGFNDEAAIFRSTAEGETGHAHGHLGEDHQRRHDKHAAPQPGNGADESCAHRQGKQAPKNDEHVSMTPGASATHRANPDAVPIMGFRDLLFNLIFLTSTADNDTGECQGNGEGAGKGRW